MTLLIVKWEVLANQRAALPEDEHAEGYEMVLVLLCMEGRTTNCMQVLLSGGALFPGSYGLQRSK